MPLDDDIRRQLGELGRLWVLAAVCAATGAVVVWRTGRLVPGIFAFLAALAVLGPFLWRYERRHRRQAARRTPAPSRTPAAGADLRRGETTDTGHARTGRGDGESERRDTTTGSQDQQPHGTPRRRSDTPRGPGPRGARRAGRRPRRSRRP